MDPSSLAEGPLEADLDLLPLGAADQSCKECRRRKAKCDRAMPTCGLCKKYGRHCLYEKHSRTPLTRRHLTEVEERLERAEALIRRLRRTGGGGTSTEAGSSADAPRRARPADDEFDFCELEKPSTTGGENINSGDSQFSDPATRAPALPRANYGRAARRARLSQHRESAAGLGDTTGRTYQHSLLEAPPRDDFEWDELDVISEHSPASDMLVEGADEDQIKDGMASLAVSEREGGYLGVASGAAMLRLLEPNARPSTPRSNARYHHPRPPSVFTVAQPNPNRHIVDYMIDSYFSTFHPSYPIIHEPTFRAQYSEVIPQPHGRSWQVLAYAVAAFGVNSSADTKGDLDLQLFSHARSMLSFDFLELGNLTLVQALTLISNYQQKRNKPNSGYNYLGLAVRMATGLGLHKEFAGWNISPLKMEIRRRVWWTLCVFDVGATITFSRPMVWPYEGVEVGYPMNVTDRELTASSSCYPSESHEITPYSAVSVQARFHVATQEIYSRVISKPFPPAEELLRLDSELIGAWRRDLPPYFNETCTVPPRYALAQAIMQWRLRNFRIIMYRPFVIRAALQGRQQQVHQNQAPVGVVVSEYSYLAGTAAGPADRQAYDRCLEDARFTIHSIHDYYREPHRGHSHNRLGGWYALYFIFQAAMIPCICLRNAPAAPAAPEWTELLRVVLRTIEALRPINASAVRCHQVIVDLCGPYLAHYNDTGGAGGASSLVPMAAEPNAELAGGSGIPLPGQAPTTSAIHSNAEDSNSSANNPEGLGFPQQQQQRQHPSPDRMEVLCPTDESPQTQINQVFPMMWPNVTALEASEGVMGDDAWLEFLNAGGGVDDGTEGAMPAWEGG